MNDTYLDHNATTALDRRVLDVMLPWLLEQAGNPTSRHTFGRTARNAIEHARTQVAEACGAHASQVIFTASGTESNNFAIKGISANLTHKRVLLSTIEHPCVARPAATLQAQGFAIERIDVDYNGKLNKAQLKTQLKKPAGLISVMLANNETGGIQDIAQIGELVKQAGALMHTDAVQGLGKLPLHFNSLNVHAMTISSHKVHGPQGAAALILDKRVDIQPLLHGGGQEKGLRSGTENIAAIVGFGMACELAMTNLAHFSSHTAALRDRLEQGLMQLNATRTSITIFGKTTARLPNTSFFAVDGIEGETLVMALDRAGFAVASGSACSSDSTEPSHVLLAMGVTEDLARGAIRVSFGTNNTLQQVDDFLATLTQEISRLKQLTSIAA